MKIPLEPRPTGCVIPLTTGQHAFWTAHITKKNLDETMVTLASVRIFGPLDVPLLRHCLQALAQRHESLRTKIVVMDGVPSQWVDEEYEQALASIDLSSIGEVARERELGRVAEEFDRSPMDLSVGPLFRTALVRLAEREYVLLVGVDHIVSDGVSCAILSKELWTLYDELPQGGMSSLPRLQVQFPDYAVWQHRSKDHESEAHAAYWKARLCGAPRMELPLKNGSSDDGEAKWSKLELPLGGPMSERIVALAKQQKTLVPLVALTTAIVVISHWCHQQDVGLVFASHGRSGHPSLQGMIGLLAESLYLRIRIATDNRFVEVLDSVKHEFYGAQQHQHAGGLSNLSSVNRPQIGFNWIPTNWGRHNSSQTRQHRAVTIEPFKIPIRERAGVASWPELWIEASLNAATDFSFAARYRSDLLQSDAIARFGCTLKAFAEAFVQNPLSRISMAKSK